MSDRLQPILARRKRDVQEERSKLSLESLERQIANMPPPRPFCHQLSKPGLQAIAEIKRASPSAGAIRQNADPAAIAALYEQGGAACLSVLTEPHFFQGSDRDLLAARGAVSIPVLRKDFIVDAYQLAQSRVMGADCVLLIVAALGKQTASFLKIARDYRLDALVEVHDCAELEIALEAGSESIGVNNRNLTSFEIDLATSEKLLPLLPGDRIGVAESGLEEVADFQRMADAGAQAVLVGSSLMRSDRPGQRLAQILSCVNRPNKAMS